MGSIRFVRPRRGERAFGGVAAEAESRDADGMLISMAVNLDTDGELYELDIWRVDFAPLHSFPRPDDLRILSGPATGVQSREQHQAPAADGTDT